MRMQPSGAAFDAGIETWVAEQRTPWARLKYAVTASNLRRNLGDGPLRILDAGGGNGADSLPLAAQGHSVTIVDYSAAMLGYAERQATAEGLRDSVVLHHAELDALPTLFPPASFDLVLCHNVLQYIDDVPQVLEVLVGSLAPAGVLSLLSVNRYALPYRAAFLYGDLDAACAALDERQHAAVIFGQAMTTEYSADEVLAMLPTAGCMVLADYGIHCITPYWGDNERKADPVVYAQLERLELALTVRHPYKLLARYFQIVARQGQQASALHAEKGTR